MTTPTHNNPEETMVFRNEKTFWWALATIFGISVFLILIAFWFSLPTINSRGDRWAFVGLFALFAVPAVGCAWFGVRCKVVVDNAGLTFFGFVGRRFYAWTDIEDYEFRMASSKAVKSTKPIAHIKVRGQWKRIWPMNYVPYDALLERIWQEAKWSKAKTWQQSDLREDGEWPKTFEYPHESGWKLAGISLLMFLLLGFNFISPALSSGWAAFASNIAMIWVSLSWWGRLAFALSPLMAPAIYSVILWAQYPAILTRRRFREQKIVATLDGLTYLKDGAQNFMRWDEIQSFHLEALRGNLQPVLRVIESRRHRIEYVSGIGGDKKLSALVEDRAKNAKTKSWAYLHGVDDDVLGGAASLWRGDVGSGVRVHHYRTRSARALVFLGLFITAFIVAVRINAMLGGRPLTTSDFIFYLFVLILVGMPSLLGLLFYLFASVECGEEGLRKNGVWGQNFLLWGEVERFEGNGYYLLVKGKKNSIRIAVMVADGVGLKEEITRFSGVEYRDNPGAV